MSCQSSKSLFVGSLIMGALAVAAVGCHRPATQAAAVFEWPTISPAASAVLDRAQKLFLFDDSDGESGATPKRPAIGPAGTRKLILTGDGARLRLASAIDHGTISLGTQSSDALEVTAAISNLTARVTLAGATAALAESAGDYVVYRHGYLDVADVIARPRDQGIEDYLVFDTPPQKSEVVYAVALDNVAGVRLVASTLELLDAHGVPRIRMAPPYVIDGAGHIAYAAVSVTGCVIDTNTAPPWTRRPQSPGAAACEVHISWSNETLEYPAMLDPSWGTTESMTAERDHHTVALVPGPGVLAIGGVWGGESPTRTELFSPAWSAWTTVGSNQTARYRHTSTVLPDGRVLVTGGSFSYSPAPFEASSEIYDPVTGSWGPKTAMHFARSGHTASLLGDGRVLVTGGADEIAGGESKTTELWYPARGIWIDGPAMQDGRADHSATVLPDGQRVLVVGGYLPSPFVALTSSELFDAASNSWSPTYTNPVLVGPGPIAPTLSHLSIPRAKHAAALLYDGSVLVVGGEYASGLTSDVADGAEIYIDDPTANGVTTQNGWTAGPSCATVATFPGICHRFDMGQAVNAVGAVYLIGGDGGSLFPVTNVVQYPVASSSGEVFAQRSILPTGTIRPRASLLADGRILVVGGRSGYTFAQPTSQSFALYGVLDTNVNAVELSTDRTSYVMGQPMEALFWLTPTGSNDFISIIDASAGTEVAHLMTSSAASGSLRFSVPQPGSYRVQAFHVDDPTMPPQLLLQTNSPFTVGDLTPATVSTDQSSYASADTVTVTFSGMTGTLDEVVGIAAVGATDPIALRYTVGAASGTLAFKNLPPGSYVANAYVFDLPTVRGSSAVFTVTP